MVNKLKTPYFCRGTMKNLEHALREGIFKDLDRVLWCYVTSGENAGKLLLVDSTKKIYPIVGSNPKQVLRYEELPSVSEGNLETLYIVGNDVYSFNGQEYVSIYQTVDTYSRDEIDIKFDEMKAYVDEHVGTATWQEV